MLGGWARTSSPREVPRSPPAMPRPGATAPAASSPSPKRQAPPPAGQATDRGGVGGAKLERAPAPLYLLGKRAGCGRPPSLGARVRHSASGPRRRRAGHGRRDSRTRENRGALGRWAIGGRRPRERDGAPPQGTRRHRELHGPRLIWELPLGHRGRGMPVTAALPLVQHHIRHSETTLPCASTMSSS